MPDRSAGKRRAILAAAEDVFLTRGYLGTNMDEIAAMSHVSKQTVYKHFGSKDALFIEIVTTMTNAAGDTVHRHDQPEIADIDQLSDYLVEYALRQLTVVLTPRIMQLRRLVIGEVSRFPELAKALHDHGPQRAIAALAAAFKEFTDRGLLDTEDPHLAATQFNWLVMSAPLNQAMLLGDSAIPPAPELRRHAEQGVSTFLAAYARRPRS
ncbi:TetR/AcrR family transcriptional regulator [Phytoactinopolyspora halotolerans]|uniref:TetR/AcrR family transcriptional regulator n=1 Tax=Phytoactinopolyspora halotolerans TaxID=1981512 RepID=A0A6L9S2D7_9ACTN|nr:TetR/AcrR family transcriptional regulator [Phytoactinopolyspora halotolerans]